MSYDTDFLVRDYFKYVRHAQELLQHEPHALKFARALEIRVRIGLHNRCHAEHENGPCITVQPWHYGNSDVIRHETAHILLWWSGLEAEIIEEYGEELGWKVVEKLCNYAITFLKMPQPVVDAALAEYGVSAAAVDHLRRTMKATPEQALHRVIYDDMHAERAGWLMSGERVSETAHCNWSLPFGWLDHVPDLVRRFPREANVTFKTYQGSRLIGVCWG